MSKVKTTRGTLCRAEHRDQGIGGGFKERETASDNEQGPEEHSVRAKSGGGVEKKGPGRIQTEPNKERRLVAQATRDETRRQRQQEIAGIKRTLDQPGSEV